MDRTRIHDEVVEILSHKLHRLPPLPSDGSDPEIDYNQQVIKPDITDNHLDIAEVAMDLEDAFGINFDEVLPGDPGLETIGKVIEFIAERVDKHHKASKSSADGG